MKKIVTVRNVRIGEGIPKICVPIVGTTKTELLQEAKEVKAKKADLVEWRVDWFEAVFEPAKVEEAAVAVREELSELPLLVTFRTKKEGGEKGIEPKDYMKFYEQILSLGVADLIDVELFTGEDYVTSLVHMAHEKGVKVVMSNHDFHKTPAKEEIIRRLVRMQELGADLPKIAVMPNNMQDVLEVLQATNTMQETYADRPIITMSMTGKGVISRLAGEAFGSAVTFGAATQISAPGQIGVDKLRMVLEVLHESMQ